MIHRTDLRKLVRARVRDAQTLVTSKRYDGAIYLCGYAVELALKARICRTLKWSGYPDSGKEFDSLRSFKTHDLDVLLHLSGVESKIKNEHFADWSNVTVWDPEPRYKPVGSATLSSAESMIESTKALLKVL